MSDGSRRMGGGAHLRLPAVNSFDRWYQTGSKLRVIRTEESARWFRDVGPHLFVQNRALEPTNAGSGRALRACAVDRKITDGVRQEWGARLCADIRSVIETARRRSIRAIDPIRLTLRGEPIRKSA